MIRAPLIALTPTLSLAGEGGVRASAAALLLAGLALGLLTGRGVWRMRRRI